MNQEEQAPIKKNVAPSKLLKWTYAYCTDGWKRSVFEARVPHTCTCCEREIAVGDYFTRRREKDFILIVVKNKEAHYELDANNSYPTCRVCSPFEIKEHLPTQS